MIKTTDAELEILQVLWQQGPQTVRQVHERIHLAKGIGYTTTLKLLQIMFDKTLVWRNDDQRTHIYHAAVDESAIKKSLLNRFIAATFQGSTSSLVVEALGQENLSPEELERIKTLIHDLEKQSKS